jgi:release factor glutamine methyltransferase
MTAAALLRAASERLAAAGIDTARLDAEVLLGHVLGISRAALYTRLHDEVVGDPATRFAALLERRLRREPVAYLTGEQEFWSLSFLVTPDVLIPRPETEMIVWSAARERRSSGRRANGADEPHSILDVGTGSGCIAVAIARELPDAQITAVDISPEALAVARRNAGRHAVADRITFVQGDVYDALPAETVFDLIVSNPPYLAPGDAVSPELAFEPRLALQSGADGLDVIRRLVAGASSRLRPGGLLLFELGAGQAEAGLRLAATAGLTARVEPDLAGIPRLLVAQRRD